jgi:flagellar M-ring protein FliF
VPGAASNQPPVPATAPINGPAAPLQGAGTAAGPSSSRRDSVTNFEVDKTVRVTRAATGTVRRLNAAVVVNHRTQTDPKGKATQVELPAEELEKITALVRESVGFNQERGDSVRVINAPFRVEKVETPDVPLWQRPEVIDLLRSFAVPGALALVALAALFGLVRPALKTAMTPPAASPEAANRPGGTIDAVVGDAEALPAPGGLPALEAPTTDDRLEKARKLARDNPAAVAGILRGWVSGEPA